MGRGHKPLLAELHAHTTWSGGVLTPGELVDLPEHLFTWKTLLRCEPSEPAVVAELRSARPCALMRIGTARVAA
jgi:hypothetical protein